MFTRFFVEKNHVIMNSVPSRRFTVIIITTLRYHINNLYTIFSTNRTSNMFKIKLFKLGISLFTIYIYSSFNFFLFLLTCITKFSNKARKLYILRFFMFYCFRIFGTKKNNSFLFAKFFLSHKSSFASFILVWKNFEN